MRKALGIVLIVLGILIGLYVGVWVLFVGGVVDLVDATNGLIDGTGLEGILIAVGILKIMFAGFIGYVCAFMGIATGIGLISKD